MYTFNYSYNFAVKVREPFISSEPNVSVYKTGESVQLNCKADGNPNPHYSWFKGNISDTFISDNDTLVITNANISDSGVYTCNTSNEINGEIFSEFKSRKVRIGNYNKKNKKILSVRFRILSLKWVCIFCLSITEYNNT